MMKILTIKVTTAIYYFLWDIIFGTAKITRKYPKEVGVENLSEVSALNSIILANF